MQHPSASLILMSLDMDFFRFNLVWDILFLESVDLFLSAHFGIVLVMISSNTFSFIYSLSSHCGTPMTQTFCYCLIGPWGAIHLCSQSFFFFRSLLLRLDNFYWSIFKFTDSFLLLSPFCYWVHPVRTLNFWLLFLVRKFSFDSSLIYSPFLLIHSIVILVSRVLVIVFSIFIIALWSLCQIIPTCVILFIVLCWLFFFMSAEILWLLLPSNFELYPGHLKYCIVRPCLVKYYREYWYFCFSKQSFWLGSGCRLEL